MYFTDLDLNEDLLDALYDMRFDECTPIQEQCIPHILEGRDLVGIAQTGTGKTAAYLLPLLTLLRDQPHPEEAVNCLIMVPTRELVRQIDQALQGFAYYMDINGVAIYGGNDGVRYEQERRSLTRGADIVIATPGRLITHMSLGCLDLSKTTHLVLDEADRMLDMGFCDDIMKIVEQMPKERQTILFSATMPEKIAELSRSVLNDPVEVRIAISKPAEKIEQGVYLCKEADKITVIEKIFAQEPPERVIVFASSKLKVKELHKYLVRKGFNTAAMHSDLDQKERDTVMLGFKAQRISVLVATDIVARGIDIDDIRMVINYDAPRDAEEYVHRIGRTARAGREGKAITLVGERDFLALKNIEKLMEVDIPRLPLPEGLKAPEMKTDAGKKGRGGRHGGGKNGQNVKGRSQQKKSSHGQSDKAHQVPKDDNAVMAAAENRTEGVGENSEQKSQGQKRRSRNHHRNRKSGNKPIQQEVTGGERPQTASAAQATGDGNAEQPRKKRFSRPRNRNRKRPEGSAPSASAPATE